MRETVIVAKATNMEALIKGLRDLATRLRGMARAGATEPPSLEFQTDDYTMGCQPARVSSMLPQTVAETEPSQGAEKGSDGEASGSEKWVV